MKSNINIAVIFVRCLLAIPFLCVCTNAQDFGRIDTISANRSAFSFIQVYGDTIIRAGGQIELPSNPHYVDVSVNGGKDWKALGDYSERRDAYPSNGSFVLGYRNLGPGGGIENGIEYWIVRHGRIAKVDTSGVGHTRKNGIWNFVADPLDPSLIFYTEYTQPVGSYQCALYTTTDDGSTWRYINLPRASQGSSNRIEVRFDYAHKGTWFVGINGRDSFNKILEPEWYRTTDSCKTLERLKRFGNLVGVFGEDTYVEFPYYKQVPWQSEASPGNPAVYSLSDTAKRDTLPWIQNMYRDLFPGSSDGSIALYSNARIDPIDFANDNFAFHPAMPGFFVIQIAIDSLFATPISSRLAVVVTTDYGATWQWLWRPVRMLIMSRPSIDPLRKTVWIPLAAGDDSVSASQIKLIRVTPWAVSVSPAPEVQQSINVWPNPANESLNIEIGDATTIDCEVSVTDALGIVVHVPFTSVMEGTTLRLKMDVHHLHVGSYMLTVREAQRTHGKRFVILF